MSALVAALEDDGIRTDVAIARASGRARSVITAAHRRGDVLVNGAAVKGSWLLHAGDTIEYTLPDPIDATVEAQAIALDIVFEDETLLVVNKPAGMVTHPATGSSDGTLVNALLAHVEALPGERSRAGLVHRLDRDTSGLLVVAKTPEALTTLGRAMQARYIKREYLALCAGDFEHPEGTIDGPIGRDANNRMKYAIRADGRPAVTHFTVRERLHHAAELVLRLETGRTHQIRVHLAALGHPVINDPVYGRSDSRLSLPGQALHAWRLSFKHPRTKAYLDFEAEPPLEYLEARETLRA